MKKIKNNLGLFFLFLVLIGAIIFVFNYENKSKKEYVKKEEEITYTEEEIKNIYALVNLSFEEESVITKEEITLLDKGLTKDELSDEYILVLAINNTKNNRYKKENITSDITDSEGYVYRGIYIEASKIRVQVNELFGNIQYNDKTLKFVNKKYVYDANKKIYRVYDKVYNPYIDKVTYIESSWDKEYIYITEYVAYTKTNINPETSFTRHNNLLPINITDINIIENLDIIDKYKYTFKVDNDKYYLEKIEYIK